MINEGLSTHNSLRMLNDELKIIYKKNYTEKSLFHYFILALNLGILKHFLIANILLTVIVVFELFYRIFTIKLDFSKLVLCINFLFIIAINFILISRGTRSRYASIYRKFQLLIDDIQQVMDFNCKGWSFVGNYPFVKIPFANSVNLQWTIRDNQLINLPVALLVKGDTIKLRPGQYIFADCEIDNEICEKNHYKKTYTIGQTFVSDQDNNNLGKPNISSEFNHKVIPMKACVTAIITRTPIISLIDDFFIHHNQKDAWLITVPERYIQFSINALLMFVLITFILNTFLHVIWSVLIGRPNNLPWSSTISQILLLGIPIQLPVLLLITLANTTWKINCLNSNLDRRATLTPNAASMESVPSSITTTSSGSSDVNKSEVIMYSINVGFVECIRAHWNQIINQDCQFVKMIYNMGSLTSLCCVDKKGILADPIATPEKIFIYRKRHKHRSSSLMNLDRSSTRKSNPDPINQNLINTNTNFDYLTNSRFRSMTTQATITSLDLNMHNRSSGYSEQRFSCQSPFKTSFVIPMTNMNCSLCVPVILDMTRSNAYPYLPSFDDNRWERYISSLKPIGLNILLNNCNPNVTDRYINFADNMSAINFKNLNKSQLTHRCICELATQIGFQPNASDRFTLESTFAVCRKNEKLIENTTTNPNQVYSLPVGNVFSTVVKETNHENYQLMSQGSADLLMTMCSDYWDGKDISPLTAYDRSRILDFYNRNIFSSYCIAFSYSPLFNKIKFNDLEDQFILQMDDVKDKPADINIQASHFNNDSRSAMPVDYENQNNPRTKYMKDTIKTNNGTVLLPPEEIKSLLKHQIFLGMISLQADQVQSDVIDCINRLEQACIRFVFFSTDNQLRSRVFAERLGMESGWNCHISLADSNEISRTVCSTVRRNSSKPVKRTIEEIIKENTLRRRVYLSEPILNKTNDGVDQIVHSTTLNEKNLVLKRESNEELFLFKIEDEDFSKNSITTSTSFTTDRREHSLLENPRDHFPEDKSKLPCGIKSIRPHLEEVDNVPLQVSLFTDCNPEVDQEMMSIMREYGEIICCCGSGLTVKNVTLFASNDCAVAFVPILHKQCLRQNETRPYDIPLFTRISQNTKNQKILSEEEPMLKKKFSMLDQKICFSELSPINIACRLVALPCGLLLNRKTGFNLITYITECHRLIKNTLSCIAFYCLSCANFVILKFFLNLIILIFDSYHISRGIFLGLDIFPFDAQIIYHLYLHTPVLAIVIYSRITMLGKPLKEPPRKRGRLLTYKQCFRFIIASIGRFLPSIIVCLLTLTWNLLLLCPNHIDKLNNTQTLNYTKDNYQIISLVIGDIMFIQHNIYIVIISFAYITMDKPIWKFNYLKNFRYLIYASFLISIQFIYFFFSWQLQSESVMYITIVKRLKFPLLFSALGILVVLFFGFLATYWETKALSVEHRLARLYFGTKLGMYSPV